MTPSISVALGIRDNLSVLFAAPDPEGEPGAGEQGGRCYGEIQAVTPISSRRPHPLCLLWLQGGSEINTRPPGSRDKGREDRPCRGRTPEGLDVSRQPPSASGFSTPSAVPPPLPMLVLLQALVGLQEQGYRW